MIAEKLPLARRFKEKTAVGETPSKPHHVYYFATRDEYVAHIRPLEGETVRPEPGSVHSSRNPVAGRLAPRRTSSATSAASST